MRFSHTHVAGTGGCSRYGNVGLTPFTGPPDRRTSAPFLRAPLDSLAAAVPRDEEGEVGYYAVTLQPHGIRCELASTERVALHRYGYPDGVPAGLLVDAASVIRTGLGAPGALRDVEEWDSDAENTGGWVETVGPTETVGRGDFRGGWGHARPYSVFFCLQSDQPFANCELASAGGLVPGGLGGHAGGPGCRAILSFAEGTTVNLRVGISFVSVAKARASIRREVGDKDFDAVRAETAAIWDRLLGRFRVAGGTEAQRRLFFSLLYRLHCLPTDLGVDDEDPHRHSGRRSFTDFYCLWDSIRNANSFFHLFDPALSAEMMNSLLDIADATGWLPDAHIAGHHAYMQSACAADILFAEAALKGVPGVDYANALRHCRRNALEAPPDPLVAGRYIEECHALGYLSTNVRKGCVSRHIEYTFHDACIARLAAHVGDAATARQFRGFAARVWNLWNPDKRCFWPRRPDGTWVADTDVDPDAPIMDSWNDPYAYEGSLRTWSWNPLHGIAGLIERFGGPEATVAALDAYFASGQWAVKETRMHVPFLYSCAGRPDKAGERVLRSLAGDFADARDGLRDNEDMGCQSGYYLWNSMGLFPLIGSDQYLLTPPLFDRVEASLDGWKSGLTLTVTADRSQGSRYIVGARLGDRPLDRCWITHAELLATPRLHLVLADEPGGWGRGGVACADPADPVECADPDALCRQGPGPAAPDATQVAAPLESLTGRAGSRPAQRAEPCALNTAAGSRALNTSRPWPHGPDNWLFHPGLYMVTAGTLHKQPVLATPAHLDLVRDQLFACAEEFGWELRAWAVLANHYHIVARSPDDAGTLQSLSAKLHAVTARRLNRLDGASGRAVWFRSFSTPLTFEHSALSRLHYTHYNPQRHGVVADARTYPWCSAAWFERSAPSSFVRTIANLRSNEIDDDY